MNFVLWMAKTLMPPERADKSRRRIACIGDSITFGDGVHPNELGNRVIAEHLHKEIAI